MPPNAYNVPAYVALKSVTQEVLAAELPASKTSYLLDKLQEESAEVIQAVSKCHRFGLHNYKPGKPKTNCEHLEEEIGDLLAMVDILLDIGVVNQVSLDVAKTAKIEKLKQWSTIYENV
jgi:NTP pyrophosphatase (non-canonical NTP hydrolase)